MATRTPPPALGPVRVEPGELVRVRIRFEHDHAIHGDYDPLLGRRDLELKLGAHTFRDALPLDREQYLAQPQRDLARAARPTGRTPATSSPAPTASTSTPT